MASTHLPLLLEPEALESQRDDPGVVIVDLSKAKTYNHMHIPGAVFLDYARIIRAEKPVMGLLPDDEQLSEVFSSLGITAETHVVAYDDEGGGKASRLLWTLDVMGHTAFSLLNGGLHAWANEGHPLETVPAEATQSHYEVHRTSRGLTDKDYIQAHLEDPNVRLLDARTAEEFTGAKRLAARGGHIPGAVNLDWLMTMDRQRNLRLLADEELRRLLQERGLTPDKQIIVYCQSHHRSAHSYIMLRHLGYGHVAGYPGAWSEWGNRSETPVET